MKNIIVAFIMSSIMFCGYSQDKIRISGKVTDGQNPLPNVSIMVDGVDSSIFTDKDGRYSLVTQPRETVVFSYMGMETIEYITEDLNAVVNIEMKPGLQMLDEVVVEKRRKSQKDLEKEYQTNKKIVRTGFGYIDQDHAGYAIRVIDGEQLNFAGPDFLSSLQSLVPGLRIARPEGISRANSRFGTDATKPLVMLPRRFMSFQNPRPVAYEVDGQLMTAAPVEIQVFNIKRIAVISSVSALSKYGQIAAGGLIVINTRGGVFDTATKFRQSFDQARKWDNVFKENLFKPGHIPRHSLIQLLSESKSLEEAKSFMEKEKLLSSVTIFNQLEIAEYFLSQWNEQQLYLDIVGQLIAGNKENAVILKSLAYSLEKNGFAEQALGLYEEVFRLRPNYAQSYRDLANAYMKLGQTDKSVIYLGRYIRYVSLDTLSTPAAGIDSIIFTEYDHLLSNSGIERYDSRITAAEDKGNIRLLFEWSHGDAEFELQFVNPARRYYTWKHSLEDSADRIRDEKMKGYSSEQFFIDDSMTGKWQVNMKYLGNRSYDPTYLKISVYYNYGTEFERVKTYVHKLTEKNVNYKILDFVNRPIIKSAAR